MGKVVEGGKVYIPRTNSPTKTLATVEVVSDTRALVVWVEGANNTFKTYRKWVNIKDCT